MNRLKQCKHKVIKDYIDIDLECSQLIYDCEKCEIIFPNHLFTRTFSNDNKEKYSVSFKKTT